ncbi:MAG: DoxX family protein [Cyclobacteriaceae bacterium]
MNKRNLIIYRVFTGLFSAHQVFAGLSYIFMHDMVSEMFQSIGVPPIVIYPMVIAKVLGLVAIWSNKSRLLKELAYLGFAVEFVLASITHAKAGDGGAIAPLVVLALLIASFIFHRKVYGQSNTVSIGG